MRFVAILLLLGACRDKDAPPDDTADSGQDAAGLAGAIGAIEYYTLIGDYWAEGSSDYGLAWWGLVEPLDFHYSEVFGGVIDGCTTHLGFPRVTLYDLGVGATTLVSGAVALTMPLAEDGFFAADLSAADFVPEARYDLSPIVGGGLDGMAVSGITRTPGDFALLTPALGGAQPIALGPEDLSFTWASAGADAVYLLVQRRDLDDLTRVVEEVGCVVADDGAFTLPADAWDGAWTSGQWIYVYAGAATEADGIVPLNGADSRMVGISWQLGAALAE